MSERALSLHRGRRIVALASLVLTAGYSYYAWTELGFGRWRSPGAAIFPLAVGAIVAEPRAQQSGIHHVGEQDRAGAHCRSHGR